MAEPICSFFGVEVPAGKEVQIVAAVDEDMDGYEIVHVTQVALGAEPAKGAHTLFVQSMGQKVAVGTLDSERHPQFSVDYTVSLEGITLSHTGRSTVHVSGYKTLAAFPEDGEEYSDDSQESGSSEDEDDDGSYDSQDDDVPVGVPLLQGRGRGGPQDEEEDSEEDSDVAFDSEEEDALMGDSDEDEEDEDGEDEDGDSQGEESEEEPEPEPVPAPAPNKRARAAAARAAAVAAPAAKKAKPAAAAAVVTPAAKKAPAVLTPATPAATPGSSSEYVTALQRTLAEQGPMKMAALGGVVKRPPKAMKLKAALEQHKAVFHHDTTTDIVSLVA